MAAGEVLDFMENDAIFSTIWPIFYFGGTVTILILDIELQYFGQKL